MWLFAGLGNPGGAYAGNRHNIGFMLIDALAGQCGASSFKSKYQSLCIETTVGKEKVLLMKPQTFMNNSGQSVQAAAKFYKIDPDRIVVFHDELDLAPGKVRVKLGGGLAGHNGLKSIKAHLHTEDFWRVRMGIGHPGEKARVHNYVLGDFSRQDEKWLDPFLHACARHAELLVKRDMAGYMSKVSEDMQSALSVSSE